MSIFHDICEDVRFYHKLRFPRRPPTFFSWAMVLLGSRGLFVLFTHRFSAEYKQYGGVGIVKWMFMVLLHLMYYLSEICTKCQIASRTLIAPGVFLSNSGHLAIGPRSIGSGTIIHDRVTIGNNSLNKEVPTIGSNVWIGPNCVIFGGITVSNGVTVLPDSVLSKSVPPCVVVQGNPARIVKSNFDNTVIRQSLNTDISTFLDNNNNIND